MMIPLISEDEVYHGKSPIANASYFPIIDSSYYSKGTVKKRGWTEKAIKLFLQTPDKETANPCYRRSSSMKLYLIKRDLRWDIILS